MCTKSWAVGARWWVSVRMGVVGFKTCELTDALLATTGEVVEVHAPVAIDFEPLCR